MNVYDYLLWRGDLSFKASPFNDVDNLLFSYISYVYLDGIVPTDKEYITIKQAGEKYFETHDEKEILKSKSFIAQAPLVLKAMGQTERFADVKLYNYVNKVCDDTSEQFSAMHIEFMDGVVYLAYRGTDDTIIGWKEDFQLCYKVVDAEKDALQYLQSTINPHYKYYIGGHSKGGVLAQYAATKASPSLQKRFIKVYSNDGPGLNELTYDEQQFSGIKDKFVKIVPDFSVIGMLFDNGTDKIAIKSKQVLIMKHDAVSWQIQGNGFVKSEGISQYSYMIKEGFDDFLKTLDYQQREHIVDQVFDALDEAGINTVMDFSTGGYKVIIKLINELSDLDKQSKDSFNNMIAIFTKMASEKASETVKRRMKDAGEYIDHKNNELKKKIADTEQSLVNSATEYINRTVEMGKNKGLMAIKALEEKIIPNKE